MWASAGGESAGAAYYGYEYDTGTRMAGSGVGTPRSSYRRNPTVQGAIRYRTASIPRQSSNQDKDMRNELVLGMQSELSRAHHGRSAEILTFGRFLAVS